MFLGLVLERFVSFTVFLVPTEEDDDDDDNEGKEEEEEEEDDEIIEEDCCIAAAPSSSPLSVKSTREILEMVDAGKWSRNLEWRSSLSSSMIDSSNFPMLLFLLVGVIMKTEELKEGKEEVINREEEEEEEEEEGEGEDVACNCSRRLAISICCMEIVS
jgi:hypothetical protein